MKNKTDLLLSSQTNFVYLYAPTAQALAVADFVKVCGMQGQDWSGLLVRVGTGWVVLTARAVLGEWAKGSTTFPNQSITSHLRSFFAEA
jgi:hypothetical protein